MATTVDPDVWRNWDDPERDESYCLLVLRSPKPITEALPLIEPAIELVLQRLENSPDYDRAPWIPHVGPTPMGVAIMAQDGEDLSLLLTPLARHLTDIGVDGTFTPFPDTRPPVVDMDHVDGGFLELRVALQGVLEDPGTLPRNWVIPNDVLTAVVDIGANWVTQPGGALFGMTPLAWPAGQASEIRDLLGLALRTSPTRPAIAVGSKGGSFRLSTYVTLEGHAGFALGPLDDDPSAMVNNLAELLVALEPWITYGFIRRAGNPMAIGHEFGLSLDWIAIPSLEPGASQRAIEEVRALDAFPVQLIKGRVRAPNARWTAVNVGASTLLRSIDSEARVVEQPISDSYLQQARYDLRHLLAEEQERL